VEVVAAVITRGRFGQRMAIDVDAVEEGNLVELGLGAILAEPPSEHTVPHDLPHCCAPLPFLPLVEVRHHNTMPPVPACRLQKRALSMAWKSSSSSRLRSLRTNAVGGLLDSSAR